MQFEYNIFNSQNLNFEAYTDMFSNSNEECLAT